MVWDGSIQVGSIPTHDTLYLFIIMWYRKRGDGKIKCQEFYDKYDGEKITFASFYQKVRKSPDTPREELIVASSPWAYKYRPKRYTGKYPELWEWYSKQDNPEIKFSQFVARVKDGWYTYEQALLTGQEWQTVMEEKAKTRVISTKKYVPTRSKPVEEKPNEDYFFIKIKYPTKVARVFVKEYEDLIEELERKVRDIFDKESRNKIEADIVRIKAELMVFKSYNKL